MNELCRDYHKSVKTGIANYRKALIEEDNLSQEDIKKCESWYRNCSADLWEAIEFFTDIKISQENKDLFKAYMMWLTIDRILEEEKDEPVCDMYKDEIVMADHEVKMFYLIIGEGNWQDIFEIIPGWDKFECVTDKEEQAKIQAKFLNNIE